MFVFMRRKALLRQLFLPVFLWLCVSYILLELFFPFLMPYLPLQLQLYLPSPGFFLAQNSKAGLFPRDYIAVFGDSYAQGLGDGLLNNGPFARPRVTPAHILNDATGRDVVSFGCSGADSFYGMVSVPVKSLYLANNSFWFSGLVKQKISKPKMIVAFFYEGNDLNDNCFKLDLLGLENLRKDARSRADDFRNSYKPDGKSTEHIKFIDKLIFARFFANCIYDPDGWRLPSRTGAAGDINKVVVGGKVLPIPDRLQAPSLELTDAELKVGVEIFEDSLDTMLEYFPDARIIVAYIPSTLSCYKLDGHEVFVEYCWDARRFIAPASEVARKHLLIVDAVRTAVTARGIEFVDTSPSVRRAAQKEFLHGPIDWHHFNYKGYEAVMRPVIQAVRQSLTFCRSEN